MKQRYKVSKNYGIGGPSIEHDTNEDDNTIRLRFMISGTVGRVILIQMVAD